MTDYIKVVYDEASHPFTEYPGKLCAYLFHAFGMKSGMKLLEPGCGRGEFLGHFHKLGMDCHGLDSSAEIKSFLAATGIPVQICDVETEKLPYADNTFDVIYNKSFLEHLREPDVFLSEARRILKPGGLLLCLVPDWEANHKIYFDDFTYRTPFTVVSLRDIYRICDFERIFVSPSAPSYRFALKINFCAGRVN